MNAVRSRPSSDDSARPGAQPGQRLSVDLRLSTSRDAAVLPLRANASAPEPATTDEILGAARAAAGRAGAFLVGGGDVITRPDLLALLADLGRLRPEQLGIQASGPGVSPAVLRRLAELGVRRLLVPFHCARRDAHDWLVGQPGALKTAHRAIRACLDADMAVVAEVALTRPTMPHLAETVEVLARTGVRTVVIRRLAEAQAPGAQFVSLSPRLALVEESLEQAASVALERRVRLWLRDLPLCAAPRLRPLFAAADSEVWLRADGTTDGRDGAELGCSTCPGLPRCAGAPADYVARFGWQEFIDQVAAEPRVHETVAEQQRDSAAAPMVFTWRGPRRLRCDACAETVYDEAAPKPPYEPTRAARARLVEAARQRPAVLRLVGADLLAHPQAAQLIYDALRLFRHVEVAGEASPIVDWSDLDLRRLKGLQRIDVALYGPDAASHDAHCGIPGAFAAMQRGVERLRAKTAIPVGAYAILHDARPVAAFADAWGRGALPGEPRFRLSARGDSLEALAAAAAALPEGAARDALEALLPHCRANRQPPARPATAPAARRQVSMQRVHSGRVLQYHSCGSDPVGAFEICQENACAESGCPGTAVGWLSTARSQRWSGNSI